MNGIIGTCRDMTMEGVVKNPYGMMNLLNITEITSKTRKPKNMEMQSHLWLAIDLATYSPMFTTTVN